MNRPISRRNFVRGAAAAGVGCWLVGRGAWAQDGPAASSADRLNVGFVGVQHRAGADLSETAGTGLVNVVALCDVDESYLDDAAGKHPKAKKYTDFRRLLEHKGLDAVVIGTPDHTHAVAAAGALRLGMHVYCEKPLTHTVFEARTVTDLARKHKRVTQMGTQIHAGANYRRAVEIVKAGVIGAVGEVHVWMGKSWSASVFPTAAQPVPARLNYDDWVGPAPFLPYNAAWLPETWRRYWNWGDGTLGDMACHYCDLPFWALDLKYPTRVESEGPPKVARCAPPWMIVHWDFPARGERPAVKMHWYDGGKKPEKFAEWGLNPHWNDGVLFIGEKGMLFSDYNQHHLLPEKQFADFKPPAPTIPDSIGHHKEWVVACLKNDPAATTCRFDYSGPLTETVLLGNVAYRLGKPIEWDARTLSAPNAPDAAQFLHYDYRKGWEL